MEKGIRLGCGAAFGLLFGFILAVCWFGESSIFSLAFAGLVAGFFGAYFSDLALRDGDSFWLSLRDKWWWPFG